MRSLNIISRLLISVTSKHVTLTPLPLSISSLSSSSSSVSLRLLRTLTSQQILKAKPTIQCPTEWSSRRYFSKSISQLSQSQKVWNIGKINHIALATPDLKKSADFYRDVLGATVSEQQPVPEHGVTVVFVTLGETKIELLHPLGEKSPIQSFLDKNKNGGMHHICIEVDNIDSAMQEMRDNKIRLLSETSRIGAHGKPVVFLHPKDCDGVLVELEQA